MSINTFFAFARRLAIKKKKKKLIRIDKKKTRKEKVLGEFADFAQHDFGAKQNRTEERTM